MLKILRHGNVKKAIFWALVILILPAFVFWGTGSLGRGDGPAYVGMIDGRKITFEKFYQSIVAMRAQIILNYFDNQQALDALLKNRSLLGEPAWGRLILLAEAKKRRIKVTDAEVIRYIKQTNPIFQRGGVFDERLYQYILRNNMGLEPRTFEEIVRENLTIQRLNEMITKEVTVTDDEVMAAYKRENQKFRISYLYIPAADYADTGAVAEEAIRSYYESHKNELVVPTAEVPGADGDGPKEMRAASYDDAKNDIRQYLAEAAGLEKAVAEAGRKRAEISGHLAGGKSLAEAAAAAGMKAPVDTPLFGRTDQLDGIGAAGPIVAEAMKLKPGELSGAISTGKGALVFSVVEVQDFDAVQFAKDRDAFSAQVLAAKKMQALAGLTGELKKTTSLKIALDEYQKYYR